MAFRNIKWKQYVNYIVIAALGIIFTAMTLTDSFSSPLVVIMLEKILIAVLLSVSLSMVVGFLGELSLGHAGFMCVGAYLGGKVVAGNGIAYARGGCYGNI